MAFFSRPNLDDTQFKQLSGSTLTLSGTTVIANPVGGLVFLDENGAPIPVNVSGASEQDVLTYVGGQLILKQVVTGGTSTGVYDGLSPSSIAVGGMSTGTTLTGRTITEILEEILVPTLYPTLTPPSSTFTITPNITLSEVGTVISVTGCSTLNMGSISPKFPLTSSPYRSGLPIQYIFSDWGIFYSCLSTSVGYTFPFSSHPVGLGNNSVSSYVNYNSGVQPYDSKGNTYCSPLPSGLTSSVTRIVTGIYPYFYGISDSAPVAGSALISGGTKCVTSSLGNVSVDFNAVDKYLWLAIPTGTTKVRWTGSNSPTNSESIPGGLFPIKSTVSVNSPSGCWNGVNYDFYISNYKTSTCEGSAFFTMTFTNS